MTAAVLTGHGGPDRLELRDDVPVPEPGDGEVLVRVRAAAVNNTDVWTREGAYGAPGDPHAVAGWRGVPIDMPRIQGADVVGDVVGVGAGVAGRWVGRRVLVDPAFRDGPDLVAVLGSELDGGFADFLTIAVDHVHDVTDAPLDDAALAALPIAYGTAMGMLERAGIRSGEVVAVTGASGGVGTALVQLLAARGATVVALTSDRHLDSVARAGATHVVDRGVDDLPAALAAAAGGPVDAVADVVGGPTFGAMLEALRPGGRLVTCGAVAGPVVEVDLRAVYLRDRSVIGSTMHTADQFELLVRAARNGEVHPSIGRTYPLDRIHDAQRDLVAGTQAGKLIVLPASTTGARQSRPGSHGVQDDPGGDRDVQ